MRITLANCRSCGASIRWCVSAKGDRRIPVDEAPVADGGLVIEIENHEAVARTYRPLFDGKLDRWVSHFDTCSNRGDG